MSAIATYFQDKNQIHIISKLYLYGFGANEETGNLIVGEINRMYNEPRACVQLKGQETKVFFYVNYEIISIREASEMTLENSDFRNNFIRIENKNVLSRSFMGFGLGDNVGHWLTTDNLGTSTTAAHEFGHGLGLDHPVFNDYRGTHAAPPIMAPRGSLVDPQFQWNPAAKAGEFGGTMNPVHRKVSLHEIELILEGLSFDSTDIYHIGYLSNKLFDTRGAVKEGLA